MEDDIEHPMQPVPHMPMTSYGMGEQRKAKAICSSEYRFRFMAPPPPQGFKVPEKAEPQTDQLQG